MGTLSKTSATASGRNAPRSRADAPPCYADDPCPRVGKPKPEVQPLLVSHSVARKLLGVGRTKYWELVKSGVVELRQVGASTMVAMASVNRLAGIA